MFHPIRIFFTDKLISHFHTFDNFPQTLPTMAIRDSIHFLPCLHKGKYCTVENVQMRLTQYGTC